MPRNWDSALPGATTTSDRAGTMAASTMASCASWGQTGTGKTGVAGEFAGRPWRLPDSISMSDRS
eukprot:8301065-Alexandrium_andersonii.AAC.2